MRILVTGGTGFLGQQLVETLLAANHELALVTRQQPSLLTPFPGPIIPWPVPPEYHDHLKSYDAVIHLAGEPIADGRWTKERKQKIYDSRILGTREIVDLIRIMPKVHTFLCGSAVSPQQGFLHDVVRDWETEAMRVRRPGLRVVNLRTGVVLGRSGGALRKLEPFFRNHMGGPAGDGSQRISWIHRRDWINAVLYCLEDSSLEGPITLTAPEPCTNKAFAIELARIFKQTHLVPAPAFALQFAFGEMASIALDDQYETPDQLLKTKFKFRHTDLREALENIYDIDEKTHVPDEFFYNWQWIPASCEEVFAFFRDPKNLERTFAENWQFKVKGQSTKEVGLGTIFQNEYQMYGSPVFSKDEYLSEVTVWDPPHCYAIEMRDGPYERFRAENTMVPACGGTILGFKVFYRLHHGHFGRLSTHWLAKRNQREIFSERKKRIAAFFEELNKLKKSSSSK